MMASVTTHEDERAGIVGDPCKTTHMSDRMARTIQKIKAAISKIIKNLEPTNPQPLIKCNLPQLSALIIALPNWRILILRVTRCEMLFETRTNNQSSALLKRGRIASMIPMPMAPDNPLDTLPIDTIGFQLLSYSMLDHHFPTPIFEALDDSWS